MNIGMNTGMNIGTTFSVTLISGLLLSSQIAMAQPVGQPPANCRSVVAASQPSVDRRLNLDRMPVRELEQSALEFVLGEVSPNGFVPATKSNFNPEYSNWGWSRDAALIMGEIYASLAPMRGTAPKRALIEKFEAYTNFSLRVQRNAGRDGLGEPKFDRDAMPYRGPWGRPQNDGPGLRAMNASAFALMLIHRKEPAFRKIVDQLYRAEHYANTTSLIKSDAEYIMRNLETPSFELWEESLANDNFYTLQVQRKGLLAAATIADFKNDPQAAVAYRAAAKKLKAKQDTLWNSEKKQIDIRRHVVREQTPHDLDIAVILGVNHTSGRPELFGPIADPFKDLGVADDRVMATHLKLKQTFQGMYRSERVGDKDVPGVNAITFDANGNRLGPAIGRYKEDKYNGDPIEAKRFTGGHPWPIATFAMGEYLLRVAADILSRGEIEITPINREFFRDVTRRQLAEGLIINHDDPKERLLFNRIVAALEEEGLSYYRRVIHHLGAKTNLPEQFDRVTGAATSVPELGWSNIARLSFLRSYRELRDLRRP